MFESGSTENSGQTGVGTRLFNQGFTDLVAVVPPDGILSPNSRIKPEARGKVPGRRGSDGLWHGYSFVKEKVAPADLDAWGANIGLLGEKYPGLDIDVEDPTLAKVVEKVARDVLGPAPIRLSREPRRLMVYRTDTPFLKMAAKIQYIRPGPCRRVLGPWSPVRDPRYASLWLRVRVGGYAALGDRAWGSFDNHQGKGIRVL